jgi:hypothetical protein
MPRAGSSLYRAMTLLPSRPGLRFGGGPGPIGPGYPSGCPGLSSCIATFVAFCGMVGLRAKVLGRLGRKPSPHPRACALSCPSLVVYRAGVLQGGLRPLYCLQGRMSFRLIPEGLLGKEE